MSKLLNVFVATNPIPKARPRLGKHGTYTPETTKAYEQEIALSVMSAIHEQGYNGTEEKYPVMLILHFYRSDKRRADLDNLQKAVLDAMNGIAYADDSLIMAIVATVERGVMASRAGVSITIRPYFEELSLLDNLDFDKRMA